MSSASTPPFQYRCRASVGDSVVAESEAAVRVERPGEVPQLWFPRSDVVAETLADPSPSWRAGTDELSEYVAFDHERVDVQVEIDGSHGDDRQRGTWFEFPNWGDASDMINLLDMTAAADNVYLSDPRGDWARPVVEGSQLLAQAMALASRDAPGRRMVSGSMTFARAVDDRVQYGIEVDHVASGRTFTAVRTTVRQGDRVCAFGTLLLDVTASDGVRHAEDSPDVPGPYDSAHFDMSMTGRDLRVVDAAYTDDPDAPVGPPEIAAWVRFHNVPDDQSIHAGLLAQFAGHMSIAAALRPHAGIGQSAAHHTLSTANNAISLSIHADVRADEWMLYQHRSTFAGDGMTHSECRVFDEQRALVASFTVDAMVRGFNDTSHAGDYRSAM